MEPGLGLPSRRRRCLALAKAASAVLTIVLTACSSPSRPSSTTLAAPTIISRPNGASLKEFDQPIAVVVRDPALAQTVGVVTDTVEVAADVTFATLVAAKTVSQSGTETTVTLDTLPANAAYYLRIRRSAANAGRVVDAVSAPVSFQIRFAVPPGPYRLTITKASPCNRTMWPPTTWMFDGIVARSGNVLMFAFSQVQRAFKDGPNDLTALAAVGHGGVVSGALVSNGSVSANPSGVSMTMFA